MNATLNIRSRHSGAATLICLCAVVLCAAVMVIAAADEHAPEQEVAQATGNDASPQPGAKVEGVVGEVILQRAPDEVTLQSDETAEDLLATPAERRARTSMTHPELAMALRLDAETEERLLDLLSQPQMRDLERVSQTPGPYAKAGLQTRIDAWNRQLDALRSLLGDSGFERYQRYIATMSERVQANVFDERLASEDKLDRGQKDKLIALYEEGNRRSSRRVFGDRPMLPTLLQTPTEERQRSLELLFIAAQAESLVPFNRWFADRAAKFLTPPQQAALAQMHATEETALRDAIEQVRADAGLAAAAHAGTQRPHRAVSTQVRLDLVIAANGNSPVRLNHIGRNGEPVTVELTDGLIVEATPTLYDDDWLLLETRYYERRGGRKRQLATTTGYLSMHIRGPDSPAMSIGDNEAIVVGSEVYLIGMGADAAST